MARITGGDLPKEKRVEIGLTYIYGIGVASSRKILEKAGINPDKYISQGNLVPDEITVPMVANRLKQEDAKDGAILDGFPRTIEQAEKLDEILSGLGKKVDLS